ncbi:MAG: hypothetical protein ACJAS4_000812 [Bacteriovoracaceae bacterium]|jgi:hypothetical protein
MKVYVLLFLVLASISASVFARKPAVEDFVGVVPETYKETPKGTEVIFDFGNKIERVQNINAPKPEISFNANSWSGVLGLGFFLVLPFIMWTFITRFKAPETAEAQGSMELETADTISKIAASKVDDSRVDDSRVTHLADYRKDGNDDDKGKKAS